MPAVAASPLKAVAATNIRKACGVKLKCGAPRELGGGLDKSSVRCAKRCMVTLPGGCVACIGICSFSNVIKALELKAITPDRCRICTPIKSDTRRMF